MSDRIYDYLTDCIETEAALRDFADGECFGNPPEALVEIAMARTVRRCTPTSSTTRPLIVLSLAAAAILIAAMSRTGDAHDNLVGSSAELHPTESAAAAFTNGKSNHSALPQLPERSPNHQLIVRAPLDEKAPRVAMAGGRAAARDIGLKAKWSDTVVTSTEQGILVPVATHAQTASGEEALQIDNGVAVVPVHSTVSYTEYTGDAAP